MDFCTDCDNVLYTKIVEESEASEEGACATPSKGGLIYYCKNCGKEYTNIHNMQKSVFSINYNIDKIKKHSLINEYTLEDPTLPRASGIKCPNASCPSKGSSNIVYINYDEKNMKYIYACLDCYKAKIEPHLW
jgi:DNA-directed RNA polymerase subunit M/transcription elongation factor TFIIS